MSSNVVLESLLGALFKMRLRRDQLIVGKWEAELADDPEKIRKIISRGREEIRLFVQELDRIAKLMKEKYPEWDGTFLTPPPKDKNAADDKTDNTASTPKKKPAKKKQDEADMEEDEADKDGKDADTTNMESWLFEAEKPPERKVKSWLVRLTIPRDIWRIYFYTEKKNVMKIMTDLKRGDIRDIDYYFPKPRRELNYHELLMKDIPTIRKRMNGLLDSVDEILKYMESELSGDEFQQTRGMAFNWAYRGIEGFPKYQRMLITLIQRYE
jgi:hypothetical protein